MDLKLTYIKGRFVLWNTIINKSCPQSIQRSSSNSQQQLSQYKDIEIIGKWRLCPGTASEISRACSWNLTCIWGHKQQNFKGILPSSLQLKNLYLFYMYILYMTYDSAYILHCCTQTPILVFTPTIPYAWLH